ncbi:MAG: cation transporter, partial [Pygmaiobacter sp.]
MKQRFKITGMTCSACSAHVEKSVASLAGAQAVRVNLLQNSMEVDYDAAALTEDAILRAVAAGGYGAVTLGKAPPVQDTAPQANAAEVKQRIALSLCFLLPLMYVSMGEMLGAPLPAFLVGIENALSFALTQFLLTLPILYLNRQYYETGFRSLAHGAPNMDSLIAIGSSAAVLYGVYALYRIGWGLGHGDLALVHRYHMD